MSLTLEIPDISLNMFIGYYEEERKQKTSVKLSIICKYKNLPTLCLDDNLDNNSFQHIRYDTLIKSIIKFTEDKIFFTVEKWCYEIFQFLIKEYSLNQILQTFILKFTKNNIFIPEARSGVIFMLEESFNS